MPNFFEAVARASRWNRPVRDRRGLPPRAWINPKDFQNGIAPGTAHAAPEFPRFAPPKWLADVVEYVSEEECERIFAEHLANVEAEAWHNFAFEYGREFERARAERKQQRKIRRHKRAYHYWSGYVMGLGVAFAIAKRLFQHSKG
jgi:hypothetical protein